MVINEDEIDECIKKLSTLDIAQKLLIALYLLGRGSDVDNFGQILIYTGLTEDNGIIRPMVDDDFVVKADSE